MPSSLPEDFPPTRQTSSPPSSVRSATWRGAASAVLAAFLLIVALTGYFLSRHGGTSIWLAVAASVMGLVTAAAGLVFGLGILLGKLPRLFRFALLVFLLCAAVLVSLSLALLPGAAAVLAVILAGAGLVGGGVGGLLYRHPEATSRKPRLVGVVQTCGGILILALVGAFLAWPGSPAEPPINAAAQNLAQIPVLALPNPAESGPYPVALLTYGSGEDRLRPEYGAQAAVLTPRVDGSLLLEGWSDLRTAYWGFSPAELPLNGRVWYPQAEGRFPLVIAVHGNHPMEEYSESGYDYLGQLLASRGFIFVALDENFLNISAWGDALFFSPLKEESDARGWLVLEHLRQWRAWNEQAGSPFYRRVDLNRIALMGHSRGGEAIVVAAAFNRLAYYPDNAALAFDYGFNIRSLIALAPADGQYQPCGLRTPLQDVNYLVLHGTHDMDVLTMMGAAPFERLEFSGQGDFYKASVYIYGANHGQFNSVWGQKDMAEPIPRLYNLRQLLPQSDQQRIARVLVSAFLADTLQGENAYRRLFQDLRGGRNWLPDTIYLNQYQDSQTRTLADFSEDIDLTTTTLRGGRFAGLNLTRWNEQMVRGKWGEFGFKAVYLGWHGGSSSPASFTLYLPEEGLAAGDGRVLSFSLADAAESPHQDEKSSERPLPAATPLELTIEVFDDRGNAARLPLSRYALLQPQIQGVFAKAAFMHATPLSEPIFQTFDFPLEWFGEVNPALDLNSLAGIRLIFDQTADGVIALNRISVR
ncbi:putative ammonia monooxygenase [Bellilinea caldifistulae]|uniref:poly(ethylene terephthalate) hydrolase family protein n=1 Tax=Bellilinea caldifistulae TaxID=360411 RepID=UPI000786230D|nr:hypothetical protein [Bellilinea caldifistulae]GAP09297.1 putative ammonia monooxygenase [Bellilinea caldifistulae]